MVENVSCFNIGKMDILHCHSDATYLYSLNWYCILMFAVNYQKRKKKKALKVAVRGTDSVATLQLIKKKKKPAILVT